MTDREEFERIAKKKGLDVTQEPHWEGDDYIDDDTHTAWCVFAEYFDRQAARTGGEVDALREVLAEALAHCPMPVSEDDGDTGTDYMMSKILPFITHPPQAAKVPDGWKASIEIIGNRECIEIDSPLGNRVSFSSAKGRDTYQNTERLLCELADWLTAAPQSESK